MKRTSYTSLISIFIALLLLSCNTNDNSGNHKETEHNHAEEGAPDGEHHKEGEIVLNQLQFDALQIKIDTLTQRMMSGYIEANGTLEVPPQNEAAITTVIGANVTAIKVIEGDPVTKGQVVAYLSHPNIIALQTDYMNAYNTKELAEKDFKRQKKLYEAGVGSGANFQKAETAFKSASVLVSGLAAQLKILNINTASVTNGTIVQQIALRSPIDGFVQKVEVKTGQYAEPQTELFEIVNTHHVHADLMVFEKDVYKVKEGQKVTFSVQSVPNEELTAAIYSVSKTFENKPKALHIHAEIENKSGNLIPGMYIQGRIQTDSTLTKVLPENAIVKDGDRFYAFVAAKENNHWSFTPIEVIPGKKDGHWVTVHISEKLSSSTLFAYNSAYYLIAEMKKGETEHTH